MYKAFFKRLIDVIAAATLLLVLSPILLIVVLMLLPANKGKVFFYQRRPGRNERIFRIVKFKTMNDAKDSEGKLLPDSARLTAAGRIIRKTSLDEVPQLWNVLKGDMSLIGPRPLLIRYLPYYREDERLRHSVLPGITGLAQVSGRNLLNWDERLALDVEYVNKLNLSMDATIFIQTIKNVLGSKDIAVDANSVMIDLDEYRSKN